MRQASFTRLILLCTAAAGLAPAVLASGTAFAQTATAKTDTLQEVIVTAGRKAQNIQKTSIAVTAISGTTIQKQAETNLQQIIQTIPGVTLTTQQRGFTPTIRGQGGDLPPGSGQATVATEFDGAYNIRAEAGIIGYFDLARVEVLPGPQGTLYGVNADGGVINVISNDPVIGKYTGSAALTIGNYHLFRGEAAVNVPLGDMVALRIAGAAINRIGYLQPQQGDAVGQAVRAKLLFKPNDSLSVLAGFELDHIGGMGPNSSIVPNNPLYYLANDNINKLKNPWGTGSYVLSGPGPSNSHESEYDKKGWLNVSYNLGDIATLNILPAYSRDRDHHQLCGLAGPPGSIPSDAPGNNDNNGVGTCSINEDPALLEQLSSEERITNAPGSKIEWNVGAYHWNYRQLTAGQGPAGYVGQQSNAGFGEVTYPFTDQWSVIGGVRESFDHRTQVQNFGNVPPYTIASGHNPAPYTLNGNWSHFDWRFVANYDPTPAHHNYLSISTGYRPGGFNQSQTPGGSPSLFKTEEITAFELGSKNRFLNDTLQLNGDVFYYDEKNFQLLDFYMPNVPACQGPPGSNLPEFCSPPTLNLNAYTFGAEFQGRYNITPDDQITATGSWLDAKFSNNQNDNTCDSTTAGAPAGGCYAAGNAPITNDVFYTKINGESQPHAAAFSSNLSYSHTFDLASGASITAGANIYVSTGYWVHPIESAYSYQPAYWTQGLTTSYTPPAGTWSLNAYVRNLSNYAIKEAYIPGNIGEPRTFGMTGSFHF